jgi:hypothetical protein
MIFVFFALATIGLTNVLVHGRILDVIGVRPLLKKFLPPTVFSVFECYECSGFWAGIIVGLMLYPWQLFLICGLAGSVLAMTFTDLINYLRSVTSYEVGDEGGE